MSLYVEWLNKIKTLATPEWLTDVQRRGFDGVLRRFGAQKFVALTGPAGSGKSFAARLLAAEHGYALVAELEEAPEGTEQVVLDGAPYTRELREISMRRRLGRVIVLQRVPPQERMPVLTIALGERDVQQFQATLVRHHVLSEFLTTVVGTDLGAILRAEALARESTHVA